MTKIASDAMVIQLAIDMAGDGEVQDRLSRLNDFINTINTKAAKGTGADSLRHEQMAVEGKYDPEIQRNLEIEKAIALTNKLNLSAEAQLAILAEIEERYRKIVALQHNQFEANNMPGDDMAATFKKNVADQLAAEEAILNSKKRAAKETERLEEDLLSSREKMFKKLAEVNRQLLGGEIDKDGARLRSDAAKKEYAETVANEAKIAAAKQEAADKQLAREQADIAKRTAAFHKEYKDRVDSIKAQKQAFVDAAIDSTQRKAAASIAATELADKQANATRQQAINLLNSLEDATQRFARTTDELRAHLEAGDITNEQYAQGLANIERRQRSMAGGANNMAYAIGNTVTGLEDFVTVLSITGFGMEGFSAATRAASNNVGQAVRSLGTAAAAIAAPLVSIGMVLAGAAIPAIYSYITGTEDAEKATRKWEESLKALIRTARLATDEVALQLNREETGRDIKGMKDPDAILDRMKDTVSKIAKLQNELSGDEAELKAKAQGILSKIFTGGTDGDFSRMVDTLSAAAADNPQQATDLEAMWREEYAKMQSEFLDNAVTMGGDAAKAQLEQDMAALQGEMQTMLEGLSYDEQVSVLQDSGSAQGLSDLLGGGNAFLNMFPDLMNEAAILDQIQAVTEELAALSKEDTIENKKKREELKSYHQELNQLMDQRKKAQEEERAANDEQARIEGVLTQQQIDSELRSLTIRQKKASLLGDENEAERALLDLAMKREQMGASGTIPDDVLNNLFNMELEAIATDLEKQIAKAEEITRAVGMATEPEAYTSANKQIMEAAGKDKTKLQEQIDLLKAIRDQLASGGTMTVEVT